MSDTQQPAGMQRTVLSNVDIPFGRLILIFVKFGLAAIPAAIILSIVFMLIGMILGAIFGPGFFIMGRGMMGPGI